MEKKCLVLWSLLISMLTVATAGQAYLINPVSDATMNAPGISERAKGNAEPAASSHKVDPASVGEAEHAAASAEAKEAANPGALPDDERYKRYENGDDKQMAAGIMNAPEPIALLILGFAGIVLTRMRIKRRSP